MSDVMLERYQRRERSMAARESQRGLRIHALVTALVVLALVMINVFVASEFPWSVFPAVGMSIGVWFHWYFGVRHGDTVLQQHQQQVQRGIDRDAA